MILKIESYMYLMSTLHTVRVLFTNNSRYSSEIEVWSADEHWTPVWAQLKTNLAIMYGG